jgi:hypothetical protein
LEEIGVIEGEGAVSQADVAAGIHELINFVKASFAADQGSWNAMDIWNDVYSVVLSTQIRVAGGVPDLRPFQTAVQKRMTIQGAAAASVIRELVHRVAELTERDVGEVLDELQLGFSED